MSKIKLNIFVALFLAVLIFPVFCFVAQAQDLGLNDAAALNLPSTTRDPREMIIAIVQYLMTFLGIIAVVVILLGGFKWMVAAGNDDKVAEAKKTITAGIIGLIIIISAYAIVQVIVSTTMNVIAA